MPDLLDSRIEAALKRCDEDIARKRQQREMANDKRKEFLMTREYTCPPISTGQGEGLIIKTKSKYKAIKQALAYFGIIVKENKHA